MKRLILVCVAVALLPVMASASGILIPKDEALPPLAVKHLRVSVDVRNQVATTHVDQVFQNSTNRDLEAVYIFPLPKGAAISSFTLYMNGQPVKGEVLEKDQARKIYQDIVRRMRDPGLLEYMDNDLLRVSIYPVPKNGTQRIELEYSQMLTMEAGICEYVYPLRTTHDASRTLDDFTVSAKLFSDVPLKTVYSPSHNVGVSRPDDHHATIGFEQDRSILDRDFTLYYTVSEKDVGLSLMTYRNQGADGFFVLMINPRVEVDEAEIIPRDVTFVIDTSGSMQGDKIKQARDALRLCIGALGSADRFNIIRFSTEAEMFKPGPVDATEENRQYADKFIDKMQAVGGTNIDEALTKALEMPKTAGRPFVIIFLTDGLPTVGETDYEKIINHIKDLNKEGVRIFSFGVGFDVNTHLIDSITQLTRATSVYIKPEEDIAEKVTGLYRKTSKPVLTNVVLDMGGSEVYDVYPKPLPDLFAGQQLQVVGRYKGTGHYLVKVTGDFAGKPLTYENEASFPEAAAEANFIAHLWASRKIGYLLDEIRLHGENEELKNEVIRLSKTYDIATPYTSYLVVEEGRKVAQRVASTSGPTPGMGGPVARRLSGGTGETVDSDGYMRLRNEEAAETEDAFGAGRPTGMSGAAELPSAEGERAVRFADKVKDMKGGEDYYRASYSAVRTIGAKTFYKIGQGWVDSAYDASMELVEVKYGSQAYFDLWERLVDLREAFKLGDTVLLVVDGKAILISDEGKETLTPKELSDLVK